MISALDVEQLSAKICESDLPFSSIAELQPRNEFLGQQRAKEALAFGMETDRLGYNLFVMGDSGTGRISMLMRDLESRSHLKNVPPDYVYVNNFEEIREP